MEDTCDPGRPFVGRRRQSYPLGQIFVARDADHRHWPCVWNVGQQRAERDRHLYVQRLGQIDDTGAESVPAHRRLGAGQQNQVTRSARRSRSPDLDHRPADLTCFAFDKADLRPGRLKVVELLRIDVREAIRIERRGEEVDGRGSGFSGVVPTAEGADHRWSPQPVRPLFPDHWWHNSTVPDRTPPATRIDYLLSAGALGSSAARSCLIAELAIRQET
ncbi:unannotated protein [freshwater metagenome]|uniref:Unannotated protein n=1 Tax=freshwater metagenome TaxID=449393 RepID=A0A6J5ZZI5_9ZZZZ